MKWQNKPSISEYHPYKEEYEQLLDLNRDELLIEIKTHIDDYFEAKSKKDQEGKLNLNEIIRLNWHENSIETFYWKFINKNTKIKDE